MVSRCSVKLRMPGADKSGWACASMAKHMYSGKFDTSPSRGKILVLLGIDQTNHIVLTLLPGWFYLPIPVCLQKKWSPRWNGQL